MTTKVKSSDLDTSAPFTFTGTVTAPTFSGALTGNASTSTKLQTARNINGTSFDGSANITITASASDVYAWAKAATKPDLFATIAATSLSVGTNLIYTLTSYVGATFDTWHSGSPYTYSGAAGQVYVRAYAAGYHPGGKAGYAYGYGGISHNGTQVVSAYTSGNTTVWSAYTSVSITAGSVFRGQHYTPSSSGGTMENHAGGAIYSATTSTGIAKLLFSY